MLDAYMLDLILRAIRHDITLATRDAYVFICAIMPFFRELP